MGRGIKSCFKSLLKSPLRTSQVLDLEKSLDSSRLNHSLDGGFLQKGNGGSGEGQKLLGKKPLRIEPEFMVRQKPTPSCELTGKGV